MEQPSFLRTNFDKLLISALLLIFVGIEMHASHHQDDVNSGFSQFLQQMATGLVGALLALLTKAPGRSASPTDDAQRIADAGGSVTTLVKTEIPKTNPEDNVGKG